MRNKPKFNEKKTAEAAAYLLSLGGGEIRYIMLLKLLYMADRKAIEEWGKPITFDNYVSMKYGQVLSNTLNLLNGRSKSETGFWEDFIDSPVREHFSKLKKEFKPQKLSRGELEFLKLAYENYHDKDPFHFTHDLPEYVKTDLTSIPIPYERILEVLEYSEDDIEAIMSELHERANIESGLGS